MSQHPRTIGWKIVAIADGTLQEDTLTLGLSHDPDPHDIVCEFADIANALETDGVLISFHDTLYEPWIGQLIRRHKRGIRVRLDAWEGETASGGYDNGYGWIRLQEVFEYFNMKESPS